MDCTEKLDEIIELNRRKLEEHDRKIKELYETIEINKIKMVKYDNKIQELDTIIRMEKLNKNIGYLSD